MRLLVVSDPPESASALVRAVAGMSRPSRGRVELAGSPDPSVDGWARRVAYLGPEPGLHGWMTPREALQLAARLLGLPVGLASERIERALAWVGVGPPTSDRPISKASLAVLHRVGLAAALMADPEVLLLDEPLRGLETRERTKLLRLPGPRHTVVIASRYPASEAGLVSHVALLREGRVALVAPVNELDVAGLPMSMRGIEALAERAGGQPAVEHDPVELTERIGPVPGVNR
ncbi:MAG: ATP-binding cassette domain-containing protein [Chloroflexi bacterium]|nr:ATP-binding cassette domain-containing protein [Chloroflexota bacterium]